MEGSPDLCKVDEVGELCLCANSIGDGYYGLQGKTTSVFRVTMIFIIVFDLCLIVFISLVSGVTEKKSCLCLTVGRKWFFW